MKRKLLLVLSLFVCGLSLAQAIKVELKQMPGGEWQLLRNNEPYYIKGAGGTSQLDKLVSIGGNSVRTWNTDNAKEVLDAAHAKGLTVMMGLWVQHERHGFDYNDKEKVALQLAGFKKVVKELKDHPALLLWGIGNEVDLDYKNTAVWAAINDIAKAVHEIDPNHPTCTVTAGLDKEEVKLILKDAPEIDIYGINTYGDLGKVKDEIRKAGWKGPYIISEWGPNGHWEVAKTKWNASVEQTSTEKANSYEERYSKYIEGDKSMCIGSYVFLWGHKQETTSTWYGLFSENGESCEAVDRIQKLWTGKSPENSAPSIDSLLVHGEKNGSSILIQAEDKFEVITVANDPDGDKLKYIWQIIPESTDIRSGGDAESAPKSIPGSVIKSHGNTATLRAPAGEGAYRVFITILDKNGHYAYGNVPFYVLPRKADAAPAKAVSFKRLSL